MNSFIYHKIKRGEFISYIRLTLIIFKQQYVPPVRAADILGSSGLVEGAGCKGRVWIPHPVCHTDAGMEQPFRKRGKQHSKSIETPKSV